MKREQVGDSIQEEQVLSKTTKREIDRDNENRKC
jgi:hypothetical protein